MIESRNQWGYPIVDKVIRAKVYAAEVRLRKEQVVRFQQEEKTDGAVRLINNWAPNKCMP